jgi:UDP-2,3-diacylglucosamine pyrophosphatase LpxH
MNKRKLDAVIISDVHLGTFGCHATELVSYLRSIETNLLVLNGDIIDIWQFSKRFFPKTHMQVIKEIFSMMSKGTNVVYITGNHDESLRRYSGLRLGNFQLQDKAVIDFNGSKTWIFHGDVFDATTKGSAKLLAKLGGHGYDMLILLNRMINWFLELIGREKMSFSKSVKNSVKKAVSWIANFEQTAAELAIENGYTHVVCGHIHQPQIRNIKSENGSVVYMNSGDWIENLTSLEYHEHEWSIYQFHEEKLETKVVSKMGIEAGIPEFNVLTDEVAHIFYSSLRITSNL